MDVRQIVREELSRISENYYHGSPYEFERFDLSKVGTGDERSKFGWGLYFTDSSNTAIQYARDLSIGDKRSAGLNVYEVKLLGLENYVKWDEQNYRVFERVHDYLAKIGYEDDAQQMFDDTSEDSGYEMWTIESLYEWLKHVVGGDKAASEFLYNNCNVYGIIAYTPWLEGNVYVAFSDDNIKIIDHIKV